MKITLSLFLPLADHRQVRGEVLDIHPEMTIAELMDQFGVSDDHVWLYVVNHHEMKQRAERLDEGDHLMVFPPMGGG
jgi:molybdopterin converting factor small subunit